MTFFLDCSQFGDRKIKKNRTAKLEKKGPKTGSNYHLIS